MKSPLDAPEITALVSTWYLHDHLRAPDIEERLRLDHGLHVTSAAIRQWCHRRGYTKTKKAADAEVACKISPAVVAEQRLARANENLARWGAKTEQLVDKSLDAANAATSLRDTSVAAGTALQALRIFQMTHGIPTEAPARPTTFNILTFARGPESPFHPDNVHRRVAAAQAIEVTVSPAA